MRFLIFAALSVMVGSQAFAQNSTVIIQSGAPPYPLVTGVGGLSPDVEAAIRLSQGGVGVQTAPGSGLGDAPPASGAPPLVNAQLQAQGGPSGGILLDRPPPEGWAPGSRNPFEATPWGGYTPNPLTNGVGGLNGGTAAFTLPPHPPGLPPSTMQPYRVTNGKMEIHERFRDCFINLLLAAGSQSPEQRPLWHLLDPAACGGA